MAAGTLITLEGIDGAGKSTLARGMHAALAARGIDVRLLREPGGVVAAERIRELVHDPAQRIGPRAEALLYAAARAQLVEELVRPLLAAGSFVLVDRFVDSSLVYQGAGRRLGVEAVRAINAFATGGLAPDRTLLLELDPGVARARSSARGDVPDRIEREGDDFFARTAAAYRRLADAEPDRIRVLDASLSPAKLLAAALGAIEDLLGRG
ncbi:MAG TPA: dTMP kinase [Solirubrobacteraceae bacterium]|nr:dTMP kinase [Solirubrobacteraceae bacterium]